ncbi:MAG: TIGR03790 family protein [Verrucomicrobiota bacterium]
MSRTRGWFGWICAAFVSISLGHAAEGPLAERVILLANSDDPDSLRIARHYAEVRGVPAANIVALKLPLSEAITWREFIALLWHPLADRLIRDKWLDATPMELFDPIGRRKYAPYGHRIAALVVCRGVPLKILHDPDLVSEARPYTNHPQFRVNSGAVDAELSLLPAPGYNINAFVQNPLFQNERPADAERHIVRVSRLDGPTAADAYALVDLAVAAEKTGLLGRAYVDYSAKYRVGDEWLEATSRQLRDLSFDLSEDRDGNTMPMTARFDAPVLYFGWYAGDLDGPFRLPGFRFPPGAIALHIHSYSATSLRSTTHGWTAPLVARGVTATVGNVNEPYLEMTHRPNLLLRALARGWTLGEAIYFALPVLSWQAVAIGDPLYRPFAVSLEQQMEKRAELPPALAAYAVIRQMNELEAANQPDEAKALAIRSQRETPTLAVGMALATRLREADDKEGAGNALGFAAMIKRFSPDEWALAASAARLLAECGRGVRAVELWQTLLTLDKLPREMRIAWLREAAEAAKIAREVALASKWSAELAELTAPVEKK